MRRELLYFVTLGLVFFLWFVPLHPKRVGAGDDSARKENSCPSSALTAPPPSEPPITGGMCNIERANGTLLTQTGFSVKQAEKLELSGWAYDHRAERLPSTTWIRMRSASGTEFHIATTSGITRNDVRQHFSLPAKMVSAGFVLNLEPRTVPPGEYSLSVVMKFPDVTLACDNGRRVIFQ